MRSSNKKIGVLEVLGYLLGGAMILLAAMIASAPGAILYLVAGLAASGLLIVLGSITFLGNRRLLPVGVTRHGDTVVCRYIPWYELNSLTIFVVTPLIGITAIAAGSAPGKPVWLRVFGLIILGCVLFTGYFIVQMWRRCLVTFSPSSVTVRLPARGSPLTEIPRSHIESITAADAEVGAAFAPATVTQIALNYKAPDQSTAQVLIGPPPGKNALQVSVPPMNLYNALVEWKDVNADDPRLIDRIETILRGKQPASL